MVKQRDRDNGSGRNVRQKVSNGSGRNVRQTVSKTCHRNFNKDYAHANTVCHRHAPFQRLLYNGYIPTVAFIEVYSLSCVIPYDTVKSVLRYRKKVLYDTVKSALVSHRGAIELFSTRFVFVFCFPQRARLRLPMTSITQGVFEKKVIDSLSRKTRCFNFGPPLRCLKKTNAPRSDRTLSVAK